MIKEQNPSNLFCGADGGIFHITWELLGMAQDISHHHSDFQHKKCEERVFPTANTSSLAAKPHQSLFNLLTISSNIIPILITVHVLLCFGPFLCSGGGEALFILVPAEFWQCQGAAGGCSSPLCTPAGCQEKAEMMAEAMNIGSPPFLTDFLAGPACRNKGITLQSHRLHCPHPKAMS